MCWYFFHLIEKNQTTLYDLNSFAPLCSKPLQRICLHLFCWIPHFLFSLIPTPTRGTSHSLQLPPSNGGLSVFTVLDVEVAFDTVDHFLDTCFCTAYWNTQFYFSLHLNGHSFWIFFTACSSSPWPLMLMCPRIQTLLIFPSLPILIPSMILSFLMDLNAIYTVMIPKGYLQSRIPSRTIEPDTKCLLTISSRMSNRHLSWQWPNWIPDPPAKPTTSQYSWFPFISNSILPLAQVRNFGLILGSFFSLTPSYIPTKHIQISKTINIPSNYLPIFLLKRTRNP